MSAVVSNSWITFDLIEKLIQKSGEDNKLKEFTINDGIGKAENFCSNIVRVAATFIYNSDLSRQHTQHFIIKSSLEVDAFDLLNDEVAYFPNEIIVYDQILPEVAKLLLIIGDEKRIAPRCFATGEKLNYLIFEDLLSEGFETIDKKRGLDYDHLKLTASSLAKWHATTAHLYSTNKPLLKRQFKGHYCPESVIVETFFTNIANTITLLSRSWPGFEAISAKLGSISHEAFLRQYPMYKTSDADFNVLCHGDMWINNFLYKYNASRQPIDVQIVDFALCIFTSPAYDLFMLLYGSSHISVTPADWETLLQYYHTELCRTLRLLKYPKRIPTLTDIHVAMLTRGFHSALISLYIIGLRNMKATHDDIFIKFLDTSEESQKYRIEFFANQKCIDELKYLLKFFDRRGYLDYFK